MPGTSGISILAMRFVFRGSSSFARLLKRLTCPSSRRQIPPILFSRRLIAGLYLMTPFHRRRLLHLHHHRHRLLPSPSLHLRHSVTTSVTTTFRIQFISPQVHILANGCCSFRPRRRFGRRPRKPCRTGQCFTKSRRENAPRPSFNGSCNEERLYTISTACALFSSHNLEPSSMMSMFMPRSFLGCSTSSVRLTSNVHLHLHQHQFPPVPHHRRCRRHCHRHRRRNHPSLRMNFSDE